MYSTVPRRSGEGSQSAAAARPAASSTSSLGALPVSAASAPGERIGTGFGIFFTRIGETLLTGAAVGENGTPNVFDSPYRTLDVTFNQRAVRLGKSLTVSLALKAKNLLRDDREELYRTPSGAQSVKALRDTSTRLSAGAKFAW